MKIFNWRNKCYVYLLFHFLTFFCNIRHQLLIVFHVIVVHDQHVACFAAYIIHMIIFNLINKYTLLYHTALVQSLRSYFWSLNNQNHYDHSVFNLMFDHSIFKLVRSISIWSCDHSILKLICILSTVFNLMFNLSLYLILCNHPMFDLLGRVLFVRNSINQTFILSMHQLSWASAAKLSS